MEFNFKIKNDKLFYANVLEGNSGNANTYICGFDFEESENFTWICVFKKEQDAYQQLIVDDKCIIPGEVLDAKGTFLIGCYGTSGDKRISTNWLEFNIEEGAYCEAIAPKEPTPDLWEELVANSVPFIGENGNWYVFDRNLGEYIDSQKPARGEKGEKGEKGDAGKTPIRGVDYWTADDQNTVKTQLEEKLNFEERLARVVGVGGNALKGMACGKVVSIQDVSPLEHIIKVVLRNKNIFDKTKVIKGYRVKNTDGTLSVHERYSTSDFMPVKGGTTYVISGYENDDSATRHIAFYDAEKNFISGESNANIMNVPQGAVYARKSFYTEDIDSVQIEEGTQISEYTPCISDLSTILVTKNGETEYIPSPDGIISGVTSVYPVTELSQSADEVIIECEYNRDINKAYEELVNAIISLGGNV